MPQARYAHALFCDDIRLEVGNKVTLVGVFGSDMLLQSLPAFVPRLAFALYVVTPVDQPLGVTTIQVLRGDEAILSFESPASEAPPLPAQGKWPDPISRLNYAWHLPLPPLTFGSPCTLSVVATVDGVAYVAAKLRVTTVPVEVAYTSPPLRIEAVAEFPSFERRVDPPPTDPTAPGNDA